MKRVKKLTASLLLVVFVLVLAGCATHVHQVGAGAQGSEMTEARQWYALWGLVPLNEVNSDEMAGMIPNYSIKTEAGPLDVLINFFTTCVSVTSRTVTVTK